MRRWLLLRALSAPVLVLLATPAAAQPLYRLVFGSFEHSANAQQWAGEVSSDLTVGTEIQEFGAADERLYRVVTAPLGDDELERIRRRARQAGLEPWRLPEDGGDEAAAVAPSTHVSTGTPPVAEDASTFDDPRREFDIDLGVQTRSYWESGLDGQGRFDPSLSASFRYRRYFEDGQTNFTMRPFGRVDGQDGNRTHWDMRELYVEHVADDWQVSAGFQQVFWGVTEFYHLVDVLNQTDLVENIDGEDKLGQPMINVSLIRDWGILDFYALSYFRDRTYPGKDGRLRWALPVEEGLREYESGDGRWRMEGAVRWTHHLGPVEFGIYYFDGTDRDPYLIPVQIPSGAWVLKPYYAVMNQVGLDAQGIFGEYLLKLEAISRDALDGRYYAVTGGFERTFVGAFGGRSDLGLILELMYDERGDEANTPYDHDLALGIRWRRNDVADTTALLGAIWDYEHHETVLKLEGSRRLGDDWQLIVEGRVFAGANTPPTAPPQATIQSMFDSKNKLGSIQRDDFLQIELTRFF